MNSFVKKDYEKPTIVIIDFTAKENIITMSGDGFLDDLDWYE